MSDLIGPVIKSRAFQDISFVFGVLCFVFAVLLLFWLYRDARRRGANAAIWTGVGVFAGIVAGIAGLSLAKYGFGPVGLLALLALAVVIVFYSFLRPDDRITDVREQQMSLLLLEAQIDQGTCPTCRHGIEPTFLVCPFCNTTLRISCVHCGKPIKPDWVVCPYCNSNQHRHPAATPTSSTFAPVDEFKEPDTKAPRPARKTTRKRSAR
ncbi:MAG: zinc ribbon domain-containing protein [Actinomycetia bacterium]|nr:zinc ribbon domain-containing protein [Actinomycetes bacterium]